MEHSAALNAEEKLRQLKNDIRKLKTKTGEFQTQNYENGFRTTENSSCFQDINNHSPELDDSLEILDINSNDSLDNETWLYSIPGSSKKHTGPSNIQQWVRQDVDNNNDPRFRFLKPIHMESSGDFELNEKRNIDSRTFTRPKRKSVRPSLDTIADSPCFGSHRPVKSIFEISASKLKVEILDDINITLYSSVTDSSYDNTEDSNTILGEKTTSEQHENVAYQKRLLSFNGDNRTKTFDLSTENYSNINSTSRKSGPTLNSTFSKSTELNNTCVKDSDPARDSTFSKVVDMNATFNISSGRSRSVSPSSSIHTFVTVPDGSNSGSTRSLRTPSLDSCIDGDQLSSASDSSLSLSNKLMNVGDVQNIARLQEESLKRVIERPSSAGSPRKVSGLKIATSTPCVNRQHKAFMPEGNEDFQLPISRSNSYQEVNYGYYSDQSDHSSLGGTTRSSRSSVKSSPHVSPFGSTSDTRLLHMEPEVSQFKKPISTQIKRPQVTVAAAAGRGLSNIRPPIIRGRGAARSTMSGLPRPVAPVRASGIPRPASSKLPSLRARSATSIPATRLSSRGGWMDNKY